MRNTIRLVSLCAAAMVAAATVRAETPAAGSKEEKVAADLANPLTPITTFFMQYRSEFGNGPDDDVNQQLRFQPSFFKPLPGNSALLLRTIIPMVSRTWPVNQTGLGDTTLVPYYVPDTTKSTLLGYGVALGLPTASHDALGSGKWTAGPALLLAKVGQPVTYGAMLQHIWSFAGDKDRSAISVSTVQPFFTYLHGGGWSSTILSDLSYNWHADKDRWTIPVNLGVSKVVEVAGQYVNLGLTGVYYVVAPDSAPDWELRLNFTYVFR